MKTAIFTEVRVYKKDNKYYTNESFSFIIKRYKEVFGNITLVTRILSEASIPNGYIDITTYCDMFYNIESIINILINRQNKLLNNIIQKMDFIILRVPSIVSIKCYKYIKKHKKKYMTEVMGCAWDAYWNHDTLGKIIAPYGFFNMKKIVYNANYSIYVTEKFLQGRYPCKNKTTYASNVKIEKLNESILINRIQKIDNMDSRSLSLMTTAAVDVKYKGQEYVIKAIPILLEKGFDIKYYLAGDGNQKRLKSIAKKYGVEEKVVFLGRLSRKEVLGQLDQIDIYIQPSLQEGLPRSVIESMSRGCIVLGAKTAGIPELILSSCVFKRKSSVDIVNKIEMIASLTKNELKEQVKTNFNKAKEFEQDILEKRREKYFEYVIKSIEES